MLIPDPSRKPVLVVSVDEPDLSLEERTTILSAFSSILDRANRSTGLPLRVSYSVRQDENLLTPADLRYCSEYVRIGGELEANP